MSQPKVSYTINHDSNTKECEVNISVKFNINSFVPPIVNSFKTEPIKSLTTSDLNKFKPTYEPYAHIPSSCNNVATKYESLSAQQLKLQKTLDEYNISQKISNSLSELATKISNPTNNPNNDWNHWSDDYGMIPYLHEDTKYSYKPITKKGIQAIINSLEDLKSSCIL